MIDLLVIFTGVCAMYAVAGLAAKCLEAYDRMKGL